jgi:hypothetical protein
MAQHIRPSGETETLVAIQVRLSEQEVALLDAFIEQVSQASHGLRISRAQGLKLAALEGLRVFLPAAPEGKKSPRRK